MNQRIVFITLLLAATVTFNGCRMGAGRGEAKSVVSASILPLQYFTDQLTGEALEVNVMIPPGASHGTYSPTTLQFQNLSLSGIYFMIGNLGYERAFVHRLGELNPDMKLVNLSLHTELIQGDEVDHGDHVHEGGIDPHIWMSPLVMLDLLPIMASAIAEVYPELEEVVHGNLPLLLEEVREVHEAFLALAETLSDRRFLIFHPALTYLARDYGFEQVAIEHAGKEPTPAQLSRLIRRSRAENIPVIFIQEEYDMRNAQLISEETGAEVVQTNPLAYNWTASMYALHQAMKDALQ